MTLLRSVVYGTPDQSLADLFPTRLPEPERLVYERVHDATRTRIQFPEDPAFALALPLTFSIPPTLNFYSDGNTVWDPEADDEAPVIPVVRGTSLPYPGAVPAISVGFGNDSEDGARATEGGDFAGEVVAYDQLGNVLGAADYYAVPLYASIVVQLIHENRDERNRLHNELRRVLAPLTRLLPGLDPQISRTTVSSEQQDVPMDEAPLVMYVSVFTVEVWMEMLQAVDVVGPTGVIQTVNVTVQQDPTIPIPPED